jgi:hypothetical protein
MSRSVLAVVLTGVAAFSACGGDDLLTPATIELSVGDGQEAPAGARLSTPLRVMVRGDDGNAFTRGRVRWRVTSGVGAVLSDSVTLSDGLGRAQAYLTLGPTAGTYVVTASLIERSGQQVAFTLSATEPPVLTAVSPTSFTGDEAITVTGQRLRTGLTLRVAGVPAEVGGVSPTGQSASATVPRCLPPGPVSIQAFVSGAPTNTLNATYVASGGNVDLSAGQYVSMDLAALAGCAQFPGGGVNGAEYLFVVQSGAGEAGRQADYRFMGDSAEPTAAPMRSVSSPPLPYAVRFHDDLRRREAEFARLPKPVEPLPTLRAPLALIQVGDQRDFRVCSKLGCNVAEDFSHVSASARYVGEHAAIFVDRDAPSGGFTDADLANLGAMFDNDLYELASQTFGAESDVDFNGHTIILMTGVVNGLTPEADCESSIVTGFFFSLDIDPAFKNDVRSNRGEVFYTLVPDPSGSVTCEHSIERIRRIVPVTFIHEFQHMISYNQHVLVRRGNTEALWLNEALSHLAEEIGGLYFLDLGDQEKFSQFVIGDLFDAYQYLSAPGAHFLAWAEGSGSLAERGAVWLFLRWLVDQHGEGLPRRLVETSLRGAENIAAATSEAFDRLVGEWALTNYVSDLEGLSVAPRLRYTDWSFRRTFEDLHGQDSERFPEPFPLIPTRIAGGEFNVTGTLRAGSGDYFLLTLGPQQAGFTVSLARPDGSPLNTDIRPRLGVVRTR